MACKYKTTDSGQSTNGTQSATGAAGRLREVDARVRPAIVWFRDDLRLADNPALRDFNYHVLYHHPGLAERNFQSRFGRRALLNVKSPA
jgi:hypothetical protein